MSRSRRALSIQAHPDRLQAEDGCRREDELGIPRLAPERNYRDRNHKPEVLYALTPFAVLRGFRPAAEILDQNVAEAVLLGHGHLPEIVRFAGGRVVPPEGGWCRWTAGGVAMLHQACHPAIGDSGAS